MKHRIFIGCVLTLCLIPSVGMLFLPETASASSQRLSAAPQLLTQEGTLNGKVLQQVTDYTADHFALRQKLITLDAALQHTLLHTSVNDQVIVGADGWLYYADTLPDYQQQASLSEVQAEELAQIVLQMQEYCQARGAQFLFTIAPNKNSLYPAAMPARYSVQQAPGNRELVERALKEKKVNYCDLFSLFAQQDTVLYLKTDTHWSRQGAALAHDAIFEQLGRDDRAPQPTGDTEERTGDLYRMLYPAGMQTLTESVYPHGFTHVKEPRNEEEIRIETTCEGKTGHLLFCRDSFGNALYPFLADDFASALITRAMPYPLESVQQGDTVIVEIAERRLPLLLENPPNYDGTK